MLAIDRGIEFLFTEYFYTSEAITIKYQWPSWQMNLSHAGLLVSSITIAHS